MLKQKALLSLFLYVGINVILLVSLMFAAPVSGAYLTWKATVGPNTIGIRSDLEKRGATEAAPTDEPTEAPTQSGKTEETQVPVIILVPATMIELDMMGVGFYDHIHNAFGVTGEACVRNSGANSTEGISLLKLKVLEFDDSQNYTPVPGTSLDLMFESELEPGSKKCFDFRLPFAPDGKSDFAITGSVTIHNFEGWLPRTENCPKQTFCQHGPVANVLFTLPVITPAPTEVVETPPPTSTPEPTQIINPSPVPPTPTEIPTPPVVIEPTAMPPEPTLSPTEEAAPEF